MNWITQLTQKNYEVHFKRSTDYVKPTLEVAIRDLNDPVIRYVLFVLPAHLVTKDKLVTDKLKYIWKKHHPEVPFRIK